MNLSDVIELRNGRNRLIGVDYGLARTGVALSDETWLIASNFTTLNPKHLYFWKTLDDIISNYKVAAFVVGLPLNMNGSLGPQGKLVEKFSAELSKRTGMAVILWDERWSSAAVEKTMIKANVSRIKRAKKIDCGAAAYILQGFLDRLND